MALLDAIGRGLSAAGATLNPHVYQDQAAQQLYQQRLQQQQQLAQQKQIAAQKAAAANLVIKAVQSGGLDPNVGNQKLQQLGYGNLAGVVSASPEAKANQQFLQLLNGQQAGQTPTQTPQSGLGTVTGLRGGLNIPASVLASSPLAQKYVTAETSLKNLNQPKAPPIRTRISGGQKIQEQMLPNGTWQQIGSGPRFKPGAAGGGASTGWKFYQGADGTMYRANPNLGVWEKQDTTGKWQNTAAPSNVGNVGANQQVDTGFTPEQIAKGADLWLATGKTFSYGRGKQASAVRLAQIKAAEQKQQQLGMSVGDLMQYRALNKGVQNAINKLHTQGATILAFENTAMKNADLAIKASQNVGRTGSPIFNQWILAGRRAVAGDPAVSAFDAALRTYANEYAKVATSATGGGVTSDTARAEIDSIINTAQSPQQLMAAINQTKMDMENRRSGYAAQIAEEESKLKTPEQFMATRAVSAKPATSSKTVDFSALPK